MAPTAAQAGSRVMLCEGIHAAFHPGGVTCRSFAALAEDPDFYLIKKLQPGDIEWISNTTILHSRTEVLDGPVRRQLCCCHSLPEGLPTNAGQTLAMSCSGHNMVALHSSEAVHHKQLAAPCPNLFSQPTSPCSTCLSSRACESLPHVSNFCASNCLPCIAGEQCEAAFAALVGPHRHKQAPHCRPLCTSLKRTGGGWFPGARGLQHPPAPVPLCSPCMSCPVVDPTMAMSI